MRVPTEFIWLHIKIRKKQIVLDGNAFLEQIIETKTIINTNLVQNYMILYVIVNKGSCNYLIK